MTAWMGDGPVQLGREAQIQMIRAEAAERAEWRQRQAEAEERREAHAGELQRFYVQHGCYPNDLLARQREHAARVEEAAEARRAQEREWLAEERRPV